MYIYIYFFAVGIFSLLKYCRNGICALDIIVYSMFFFFYKMLIKRMQKRKMNY